MRQAENRCKIEGILSEVDIKYTSFNKNGNPVEAIGGVIKIRVEQKINGENATLEIPVHMFSSKLTNKGTPNPAYESIERIMNEFTSIAAAGSVDGADKIRITNGQIQMNEYYNANGQLVSFPRISASFVTKVKPEEFKPEATFSVELVVGKKEMEIDKDGVETGRLKVRGIVSQYGDRVDVVDFIATNKGVIDAVSNYWTENDTVKASGRINFSSRVETSVEELGFGEPIERSRTISLSELIITGGSQTPLDGEFAFDLNDINKALADRKARLDGQKERDMAKVKTHQPPVATEHSSKGSLDLGF